MGWMLSTDGTARRIPPSWRWPTAKSLKKRGYGGDADGRFDGMVARPDLLSRCTSRDAARASVMMQREAKFVSNRLSDVT
jgi:hypothetical protein